MIDRRLRGLVDAPLRSVARRLIGRDVRPEAITLVGFAAGVGACIAIAFDHRWVALALWLANRLADGLDGAVARGVGPTDRGGFVDIVADFSVYSGFVIGVAVARPDARLAALVLLGAYYISGAAFLAWSSMAERRSLETGDGRSLHFVGGLAEGAETIGVYVLLCVWPSATITILWLFAAAVGITAVQRTWFGWRSLTGHGGEPHR